MALQLWGPGTTAGSMMGGLMDPFAVDRVFDRALDRAFGRGLLNTDIVPAGMQDMWTTMAGSHPMDIMERDNEYEIVADAPGMSPEEIEVTCQDGVLTVRGEHKEMKEDKDRRGRVHRSERVMRSFTRSFGLPRNAVGTEDKICACLDKGVLRVTVPKCPEPERPQPKRIAVQGHMGTTTGTTGAATGTTTGATTTGTTA